MKLRHLEVLHAILQTGSITQAARLLHVSQPSVSTTLQHCEAQVRRAAVRTRRWSLEAQSGSRTALPRHSCCVRRRGECDPTSEVACQRAHRPPDRGRVVRLRNRPPRQRRGAVSSEQARCRGDHTSAASPGAYLPGGRARVRDRRLLWAGLDDVRSDRDARHRRVDLRAAQQTSTGQEENARCHGLGRRVPDQLRRRRHSERQGRSRICSGQ